MCCAGWRLWCFLFLSKGSGAGRLRLRRGDRVVGPGGQVPVAGDVEELARGVAFGVEDDERAAEAGGADGISLINTLMGMKIDIMRRKCLLANKTGGLSGPAIKPVAVRMVYQVSRCVNVPIIGMGGIASAEDAIEFMMAGAMAVSVGTANFHNPRVTEEIVSGIERFMKEQHIEDIRDIIGCAE